MMVDEIINRIRMAVQMPGVTAKSLAEQAGLHRNTLYGLHDPDWNPSAATLRSVEPFLPPIEKDEA